MLPDGLVAAVSGGGAFLGLFVAALFLRKRARRDAEADWMLALVMLLCSINIAHAALAWMRDGAAQIVEPFQFLLPPAIAAYARTLTDKRHKPRLLHLLHLLPFCAAVSFYWFPAPPAGRGACTWISAAALAGQVVQGAAYLIPTLAMVHRYRAGLKDSLSSVKGIDLGWLAWFARIIVALYSGYALILAAMLRWPGFAPVRPALSVALSLAVFALGYRGLFQRKVDVPEEDPGFAPKYERIALGAGAARDLAERLNKLMETERLFLDPELDLSRLAALAGAPRNQVSYVLNAIHGKSFYDYVNDFRAREAMRLMRDPGRSGQKLLAIAFDSGFNSKPTFNAVFKRYAGATPSEFRAALPENRV